MTLDEIKAAVKEEATEFQRRHNMNPCEVRRMYGTNYTMTILTVYGIEVATRTEFIKRGKVAYTSYLLPSLDRLNALLALPVAKKFE